MKEIRKTIGFQQPEKRAVGNSKTNNSSWKAKPGDRESNHVVEIDLSLATDLLKRWHEVNCMTQKIKTKVTSALISTLTEVEISLMNT